MLGRMMVSALALTGVAYAQTTTPAPAPENVPANEAAATQATSTSDRVVYEAAFFQRFNPQNAMDFVNNTPGFSFDGGDGRRGFTGSVGNVLVDGLRPTAKGQQIDGILARIPAAQIVRVEVLRGAEVAGDASGQAMLLNIVRSPTAGSGVYEVGFEYSGQNQDRIMPRADIGYNGRVGQFEWGVGFRLISQNRDLVGARHFFNGDGELQRSAAMTNPRNLWDPYYNGTIAFPLFGGRFSASGMINPDWFNQQDQTFDFTTPAGDPDGSLHQRWKEEGTLSEIGLNYDRDFGPWSLAMVGLRTQHPFQYNETAREFDALGAVTEVAVVNSERETIETIGRATLSRSFGPVHRIEFGGEAALNTLDSQFQFTLDTGSGPEVIPIPNSNITVEENRADLFAVHTWRPNDRWSLESRVGWETSTLSTTTMTTTGPVDQETELSFWKPSFQLTRTFAGNNQLRFRYYRDVGQLDFDDFVSSTSLSDDLIDGGNPSLEPQTDWRAEFGGDLRFPGGAALGFALIHHDISDVNDLTVLIDNKGTDDPADDTRFDAPGNIGEAEAWSAELNFSSRLPLIPNARITIEAEFWDTEVTDPVTGAPRIISWQPESELDIAFRQDFAEQRWSWGIEYYKQGEVQGYRLTDIDTQEEGPWIDLWWETTALPHNMKLRLWAANIGDGEVLRDRRIFGSDDDNPLNNSRLDPLLEQQITVREFDTAPWFILELSGSF